MPVQKSRAEEISPAKTPEGSRKIEEIDFFDFLSTKKDRRYMEEIGVADYLKKKPRRESPSR
jgi:hypothetical protein